MWVGALRLTDFRSYESAEVALDTGVTVVRAGGACGVARACAPGWDLRVARVALPGPLVPAGATVVATAEVENDTQDDETRNRDDLDRAMGSNTG